MTDKIQPEFVTLMRNAVSHIKQAQNILARGPLEYYLEKLAVHSEALLTRFAPFKVEDKAMIIRQPKCEGGWKGLESTLAVGAIGVISDVDYYDGRFMFDWVPDVEYWRDHDGVEHKCEGARHSYRLKEENLLRMDGEG